VAEPYAITGAQRQQLTLELIDVLFEGAAVRSGLSTIKLLISQLPPDHFTPAVAAELVEASRTLLQDEAQVWQRFLSRVQQTLSQPPPTFPEQEKDDGQA
jgi:hypothetical protein